MSIIRKLNIKLSDLFLILWLGLGIIVFLEDKRFFSSGINGSLSFVIPFYVHLVFFTIMIISISIYLYLEIKTEKLNRSIIFFLSTLLFLIIIQIENISLSPNNITFEINDVYNDPILVKISLTNQIKAMHIFSAIYLLVTIYIGFTFIYKRITSIKVVEIVIYLIYIYALVVFIYSLIKDDYISFFNALFTRNPTLKDYAPQSFLGNQNTYGTFFQTCIFASLIQYSINHKRINLILLGVFYIILLSSLCKAGIALSTLILFVLFLYKVNKHLKEVKKSKTLIRILVLSSILIIVISVPVVLISLGVINLPDRLGFLGERTFLWLNSIYITAKYSFIHGVGYGIYDSLMESASIRYLTNSTSITHNGFLSVLGKGGIITLIAFIAIIAYSIPSYINLYKNNKGIAISLLSCNVVFFFHSFVEDYYVPLITIAAVAKMMDYITTLNYSSNK